MKLKYNIMIDPISGEAPFVQISDDYGVIAISVYCIGLVENSEKLKAKYRLFHKNTVLKECRQVCVSHRK